MADHTYRLKYLLKAEPGAYTVEEARARAENEGVTDALLVVSLLYPADGSFSASSWSVDGRSGEELSDIEMFKVWTMMAHNLTKSTTLDEGRREFVRSVWEAVQAAVLAARSAEDQPPTVTKT